MTPRWRSSAPSPAIRAEGAADLERPRLLQVLGLQTHPPAGDLRAGGCFDDSCRGRRAEHRCAMDPPGHHITGGQDLRQRHGQRGHGPRVSQRREPPGASRSLTATARPSPRVGRPGEPSDAATRGRPDGSPTDPPPHGWSPARLRRAHRLQRRGEPAAARRRSPATTTASSTTSPRSSSRAAAASSARSSRCPASPPRSSAAATGRSSGWPSRRRRSSAFAAQPASAGGAESDERRGHPRDRIDALDITVLRAAAPRSPRGPTSTASGSRPTRPRCSTSTRSGARSSSRPSSTATRPQSAASSSATARPSTSRSRPTTRGCRCASWASARARARSSRPTSSC